MAIDMHECILLLRAVIRGKLKPDLLVSRAEIHALFPPGPALHRLLDRRLRGRERAHTAGERLFAWGDVLAVLGASASRPLPATKAGYMEVDEAAAYLGFSSANALRMAITRKQILATARRGRRLLFTRDHLDEQVRDRRSE